MGGRDKEEEEEAKESGKEGKARRKKKKINKKKKFSVRKNYLTCLRMTYLNIHCTLK